jgi:tetratricopeptide (TPR) repeat protein
MARSDRARFFSSRAAGRDDCVSHGVRRGFVAFGSSLFWRHRPALTVTEIAAGDAARRRGNRTAVVVGGFLVRQRVAPRILPDVRACDSGSASPRPTIVGTMRSRVATTHARNTDFWSDEGIWRDTVEKRPTNPRARLNYGIDLYAAGRLPEAERELKEAVRLKDSSAAAQANLGPVLCALGQLDEGISHLERALALDPAYTLAHTNLAEAYAARGKRALAAQQFALATKASPDNPPPEPPAWKLCHRRKRVRNGARAAISRTCGVAHVAARHHVAGDCRRMRKQDVLMKRSPPGEALALAEGGNSRGDRVGSTDPLFEAHQSRER